MQADKKVIGTKEADRKIHTVGGSRTHATGKNPAVENGPPSSSANQNLKGQQCFSNKLIKKRLILKKTVQIRNGTHSLMTKY